MALPNNPYKSALQVDPAKEQAVLVGLKNDPKKMAELGLAPNEDFSQLKSDPVKYNRILSYVKGEAYKGSPYGALADGQTKSEFSGGQMGDYKQPFYEVRDQKATALRGKYNVDNLQDRYQEQEAESYSAPALIRERLDKEKGYNIEDRKDTFNQDKTDYANAYRKFVNGEISDGEYASIVSRISTSARNVDRASSELDREVEKGLGTFQTNLTRSKQAFDNAYSRYGEALAAEEKGYEGAREEKRKAAEEMYDQAKSLLDDARKEQKGELREVGGSLYQVSYNPDTGKFDTTLVRQGKSGGGGGSGTIKADDEKRVSSVLSRVVGGDGFVSPQDYQTARNAWIADNNNPADFDTYAKGFRNPNNANYVVSKMTPVEAIKAGESVNADELRKGARTAFEEGNQNMDAFIQAFTQKYGREPNEEELAIIEEELTNRNVFGNIASGKGFYFGQRPGKG